jgi:hypothetical protein
MFRETQLPLSDSRPIPVNSEFETRGDYPAAHRAAMRTGIGGTHE